jgi:uncharacterized membrane protein
MTTEGLLKKGGSSVVVALGGYVFLHEYPFDSMEDSVDMPTSPALDRTFRVTVGVKGLDGLLETLVGTFLLFVSPSSINRLVTTLTSHELAQDPTDFVARHLLSSTNRLSRGATLYTAIYLLAHGMAKVVLVGLVLRNKLWAYPWMIALLLAFIAYQVYQLTSKFSIALILLSLFDALVVWLTWREYRSKRQAMAPAAT